MTYHADGDKAIKAMSWCTKNNKQIVETRRNKKSGWETIDILTNMKTTIMHHSPLFFLSIPEFHRKNGRTSGDFSPHFLGACTQGTAALHHQGWEESSRRKQSGRCLRWSSKASKIHVFHRKIINSMEEKSIAVRLLLFFSTGKTSNRWNWWHFGLSTVLWNHVFLMLRCRYPETIHSFFCRVWVTSVGSP